MSDGIALVRMLGALLTVLGLLAGALWMVRRYNLVLPGSGHARLDKRLAVVERLGLDPRRSLALIRRDGVEHLVMLSPEGNLVIESNIIAATPALAAAAIGARPLVAPIAAAPAMTARIAHRFGTLLEQTLRRRAIAISSPAVRKRASSRRAEPHV